MDWENLRHFAAFVAANSLSGAAKALHVEHGTIARRIAHLEAQLNVKLVDRRGRRLTLTADGKHIAAVAQRMEREADAIMRIAQQAQFEINGDVTISAPPAYAAVVLAAPLSALSHRHPHLRIHILAAHKTAGLEKREADIAIRLHRPEKGDLTAQKIDEMAFHFYATEAYLRMTPPDKHILIGNDGRLKDTPQEHILTTLQNETTQPHITPACGAYPHLTSNALEIQMALVRANAGIALLPDFMAAQDCNLIKLPSPSPLTRDVWLVIHSDFKNSPPIRAVIDALTQEIAPNHTP